MRLIEQMDEACRRHEVPLAAAAPQFSLRESRVASTIVGISAPERVEETVALARWPIPAVLWNELEPLAAPREFWLGGRPRALAAPRGKQHHRGEAAPGRRDRRRSSSAGGVTPDSADFCGSWPQKSARLREAWSRPGRARRGTPFPR